MRPVEEILRRPGGLAERMYLLRQGAGLRTGQLAEQLGWVPSKVTKIQRGQQRPTVTDIKAWAEACGHPEVISELVDLLTAADTVHWRWQDRLGHAQEDLDQQVRNARAIRTVQVAVMPGLLQTAAYARATRVMFCKIMNMPTDGVDAAVAARMLRQDVLAEPGRVFEFVITENILRQRIGGAAAMRAQLDRLLRVMDLPHITIAIYPGTVDNPVVWPFQGFLMLDDRVLLDLPSGEVRFAPGDAEAYERMFDAALAQSVTGEDARALIAAAAEALR